MDYINILERLEKELKEKNIYITEIYIAYQLKYLLSEYSKTKINNLVEEIYEIYQNSDYSIEEVINNILEKR